MPCCKPSKEGITSTPHIPIVPLAQGDMRVKLRDVLAQLNERDSVVPAEPMRLRTPLVLVSQHGRSAVLGAPKLASPASCAWPCWL